MIICLVLKKEKGSAADLLPALRFQRVNPLRTGGSVYGQSSPTSVTGFRFARRPGLRPVTPTGKPGLGLWFRGHLSRFLRPRRVAWNMDAFQRHLSRRIGNNETPFEWGCSLVASSRPYYAGKSSKRFRSKRAKPSITASPP